MFLVSTLIETCNYIVQFGDGLIFHSILKNLQRKVKVGRNTLLATSTPMKQFRAIYMIAREDQKSV